MSRPQKLISVPDYRNKIVNGEQVTFYDVYLNGKFCCTKRYNDFSNLNSQLRAQFPGYNFARFPMKWMFALTEAQTEDRRKQLDEYLKVAVANNAVAESALLQDFLALDDEARAGEGTTAEVLVRLPDKTNISVVASQSHTTVDLYKTVVKKLGLKDSSANFFALFELVNGFERKLNPQEIPLDIINKRKAIAKSSNSTSLPEIITIKKWIFTRAQEVFVSDDEVAVNLLYGQAREEIAKGYVIPTAEQNRQLNEYKLSGMKIQYLDVARKANQYSVLFFPPCKCQLGSNLYTHSVFGLSVEGIFLKTNSSNPKPDYTFKLPLIKRWKYEDQESLFKFEYSGPDYSGWVVLYSDFCEFFNETLLRVINELAWAREANAKRKVEGSSSPSTSGPSSQPSVLAVATDYASWGAQKAANIVYGTINFFSATLPETQTGGRPSTRDLSIDMEAMNVDDSL